MPAPFFLLKTEVIVEEGQQVIEHPPIFTPDFIAVIANVFFSLMVDAQVFQALAEHSDLNGESWGIVAPPIHLDGR